MLKTAGRVIENRLPTSPLGRESTGVATPIIIVRAFCGRATDESVY